MYNMSLTTKITDNNIHKSDVQNKAVFVKKYDDKSKERVEVAITKVYEFCATDKKVLDFLEQNSEIKFNNVIDIITAAGRIELLRKCFPNGILAPTLNNVSFEVICNTHKEIYPVGE